MSDIADRSATDAGDGASHVSPSDGSVNMHPSGNAPVYPLDGPAPTAPRSADAGGVMPQPSAIAPRPSSPSPQSLPSLQSMRFGDASARWQMPLGPYAGAAPGPRPQFPGSAHSAGAMAGPTLAYAVAAPMPVHRKRGRPPKNPDSAPGTPKAARRTAPGTPPGTPPGLAVPPGAPLEIPPADGTPRGDFLHELYTFMQNIGQPITKTPHLGYQELDLHMLYALVTARGGMDAVTRRQEWKTVYGELGIPTMSTSASYNTRTNYKKYLYLYELEHFHAPPAPAQGPEGRPEPRFPEAGTPVRIVSSTMEGLVFYARTVRSRWDAERKSWAYYVHYNGWSTSHDEWMPEDVLSPLLPSEATDPEALHNPPPSRSSKSNNIISDGPSSSPLASPAARRPTAETPSPTSTPERTVLRIVRPRPPADSAVPVHAEEAPREDTRARSRRAKRPADSDSDDAEAALSLASGVTSRRRHRHERFDAPEDTGPRKPSADIIREKLAQLERDAAFTGGLHPADDVAARARHLPAFVLSADGVARGHDALPCALEVRADAIGAPSDAFSPQSAALDAPVDTRVRGTIFQRWRERLSAAVDLRVPDIDAVLAAQSPAVPSAFPIAKTPALLPAAAAALDADLRAIRREYRRNRKLFELYYAPSSGSEDERDSAPPSPRRTRRAVS